MGVFYHQMHDISILFLSFSEMKIKTTTTFMKTYKNKKKKKIKKIKKKITVTLTATDDKFTSSVCQTLSFQWHVHHLQKRKKKYSKVKLHHKCPCMGLGDTHSAHRRVGRGYAHSHWLLWKLKPILSTFHVASFCITRSNVPSIITVTFWNFEQIFSMIILKK